MGAPTELTIGKRQRLPRGGHLTSGRKGRRADDGREQHLFIINIAHRHDSKIGNECVIATVDLAGHVVIGTTST